MLGIECFYRCEELLFSQSVILIGHTDIPKNILITRLRNEQSTRQLHFIIIRPGGYDFKLLFLGMVVHFKVSSVELATLKHHMLYQSCQFVFIRVEG